MGGIRNEGLDKWSQVTLVFARFAEYSNIGGNRTGGFGVTLFVSKDKPAVK